MSWGGWDSVIDVEKIIVREVRIEGDAEQAAFAVLIDVQGEERRRELHTVLDHAQTSALLADEDTAVRRDLHCGRIIEPAD